jgi:hypothetical protein
LLLQGVLIAAVMACISRAVLLGVEAEVEAEVVYPIPQLLAIPETQEPRAVQPRVA